MTLLDLFLLAVALSMDAFAVAICKGLSVRKPQKKHYLCVGLWFGGFQALMPTAGYLLVKLFQSVMQERISQVEAVDHWIAFVLLSLIGGNMIREVFSKDGNEETTASFGVRAMLPMAIATSIDAFAVGISFGFLTELNIIAAVSFIGVITCLLSAVGLKVGNLFGTRYQKKAELAGGVILILIGVKILLEHLGLLPF